MKLFIDFETRSRVDIKRCGAYVYAEDESTEVLCIAVKVVEDHGAHCDFVWVPPLSPFYGYRADTPANYGFMLNLVNRAEEIHAHNAQFERLIWKHVMTRHGFDDIPLDKWRCTAAKAAYYALPRSLDKASKALGLPEQKDNEGYRIMMKMCKPLPKNSKRAGEWHDDPQDFIRLCEYCEQDVAAEYALDQALIDPPVSELEIWRVDQRMNDRGILIDLDAVKKVKQQVQDYESRLLAELQELTGGKLRSVRQRDATIQYLAGLGVEIPDLTKRKVQEALARNLPSAARRILEIRQALGKSSVSKLDKMQLCACRDGRVRGTHLYYGAATGRWSGALLQTQNFPRGSLNDENYPLASEAGLFALLYLDLEDIQESFGCPMEVASSVLRNLIVARLGYKFMVGDYAQIEARMIAWLAGQHSILDAFRQGKDLYKVAACDVFPKAYDAIDKGERQVGKCATLALGYQGGIGAFASMATIYGVDLEAMVAPVMAVAEQGQIEFARIVAQGYFDNARKRGIEPEITMEQAVACDIVKQRWRRANPMLPELWASLELAAVKTVRTGEPHSYGAIKLGLRGNFLHMRLPSGRLLAYYAPEVRPVKTPWGEMKDVVYAMTVDSMTRKWVRRSYYGGILAENLTQAASRDLLAGAMKELDDAGYGVVLSVHDEVVAEVPQNKPLGEFERIMLRVPDWAKGLPIDVDVWQGTRYRKA